MTSVNPEFPSQLDVDSIMRMMWSELLLHRSRLQSLENSHLQCNSLLKRLEVVEGQKLVVEVELSNQALLLATMKEEIEALSTRLAGSSKPRKIRVDPRVSVSKFNLHIR
jgi:hypothetical protein